MTFLRNLKKWGNKLNWKKFFKLSKLKISILITTFIIIFFVNLPALVNYCSWNDCPDYIGPNIASVYPSFYFTEQCGGIAGKCYPSHISYFMLKFDVLLWIIINLIAFSIIYKYKK